MFKYKILKALVNIPIHIHLLPFFFITNAFDNVTSRFMTMLLSSYSTVITLHNIFAKHTART